MKETKLQTRGSCFVRQKKKRFEIVWFLFFFATRIESPRLCKSELVLPVASTLACCGAMLIALYHGGTRTHTLKLNEQERTNQKKHSE